MIPHCLATDSQWLLLNYLWMRFVYVNSSTDFCLFSGNDYRQVSNIRRTLVGNKIVDNSDVVGASPVGAAPTTSELST